MRRRSTAAQQPQNPAGSRQTRREEIPRASQVSSLERAAGDSALYGYLRSIVGPAEPHPARIRAAASRIRAALRGARPQLFMRPPRSRSLQ